MPSISLSGVSAESALWSARLHGLAERITPLTGRWAQEDILPYMSGLQLFLSGLVLGATVALIAWAHRYARRAIARAATASQPDPGTAPPVPFLHLFLLQVRLPALVFIAIWGFYCSFSILFFRFDSYADLVLNVLDWMKTAGLILDLFWFLVRLIKVLETRLTRWSLQSNQKWDYIFVTVGARAVRMVLPLLAVLIIVPMLDLPGRLHAAVQETVSIFLIGFVGFILIELASTAEKAIRTEYRVDIADNLGTRKIQTQAGILRKIFSAVVILLTLAGMLTVFEPVRSLGRSILASAGVAGIVLGIAAQRSLGTLLAGIQIAFSQPIRLDDVVIVEGEWGRIEEITLTYVVVAIWDLRRMVLPITYFIEKPFQNWTRSNAALLGTVFLYLDYTAPLAELRPELDRILEKSALWDKKVKGLQVTDAKDNVIEVRILASAANSGTSFDLRCEIREKMIDFLQRNFPGSLPRSRGALEIGRKVDEQRPRQPDPGRSTHVLTEAQGLSSPVVADPKKASPSGV